MFACSVFYCSLLILYFICIFLLLLPTWRIKLMMITTTMSPTSPFSSVYALNICKQLQICIFCLLIFTSFQQSNFWVETSLQHNSRTTRRIHNIFSQTTSKIPTLPPTFPGFPGQRERCRIRNWVEPVAGRLTLGVEVVRRLWSDVTHNESDVTRAVTGCWYLVSWQRQWRHGNHVLATVTKINSVTRYSIGKVWFNFLLDTL